MVARWSGIFLLLLAGMQTSPAQPNFSVSASSRQVEYGKSLELKLQTRRHTPSLDEISLRELQQDFVLETTGPVQQPNGASIVQQWSVRLYPRHTGRAIIPPLRYQELRSQAIEITVTPAIDPKQHTPIRVSHHLDAEDIWLKQITGVVMQFETTASIVVLDTEPVSLDGFEIQTIPVQRQAAGKDSQYTRHRIGWVLHPLQPGQHQLQLPAIHYIRDGVVTHRFYPPQVKLNVRPLPRYIPPTLPVGRLDIDVIPPDSWWLLTGKLHHLSLRLHGHGIRLAELPSLARQFKSSAAIEFYPATGDGSEQIDVSVLESTQHYQLPFVVQSSGLVSLPVLRLQYFDPVSGTIQVRHFTSGKLLALSPGLLYPGIGVMILLAWQLGRRWIPKAKIRWQRYFYYLQALRLLCQSDSAPAIRMAIQQMARAERWPANLTLSNWLQRWSQNYGVNAELQQTIERLQLYFYADRNVVITDSGPILQKAILRQYHLLGVLLKFIRNGRKTNRASLLTE